VLTFWLPHSVKTTFCKAVLDNCRHSGFPGHCNTIYGIQDVPVPYFCFRNIPVDFL
jgi:hypothetical protein